jgi:hypothetical protein
MSDKAKVIETAGTASTLNAVLCVVCEDTKHVCENHPYLPWEGTSDSKGVCKCGGAGILCPECG